METIKELNCLTADWENLQQIIPYGCGLEAYRSLRRIIKDFDVPFIIDKDIKKQRERFFGIPIVGPERLNELESNQKVLVTIARRNYESVTKEIEKYGLVDGRDFCHISQFAMEWYYKFKKEYCIFSMDVTVTTACTLKCKNCNMFIPYYKEKEIFSFEHIKKNLDLFFNRIDFVFEVGLLGGEALLNESLEEIIRYMHETYRDKFGSICVTTNGSIIPNEETLELFRTYQVIAIISDYRCAIDEKSKLDYLEILFKENGIICQVRHDLVWCEFGFPKQPLNISESAVRKHMLECNPGWRGLNDKKFFYCNVAWSAQKAGLFDLQKEDYIDLESLEAGSEETKAKILKYSLGIMEKGYMSFCRVCGGCGPDNKQFVNAGEQM